MPSLFSLAILLVVFCPRVFAQNASVGSWNTINFKFARNEAWSVFAEAQLRSLQFYQHFHYYEFKAGFNCNIHPNAALALAAGSYQTYANGGNFRLPKNNDEIRIWPQLILFQEFGKLRTEQRFRAEMRFTSNGYRNRYRYRMGLALPLGKKKNGIQRFQLGLNNELFFTDREPYFERNRIALTLQCKLSKSSAIQVGFLRQFDYKINDETGKDFIQIGYQLDLFPAKEPIVEKGMNLNDN
jgi:hypothetical protein